MMRTGIGLYSLEIDISKISRYIVDIDIFAIVSAL